MALWQFVFDLIPSSTATVNGVVAARMSREQLDSINLRFSEADATAIFEGVGKMLPEKKSWSPQLRIWGAEQTNDVQIGLLGDNIEYVQFRLNVGDLPMPLVGSICSLARELDCVLATQSGGILRPNIESIVRAIMQSDASRFVADPKRYLQEAIQRDQEQK